MKLFGGAIAWRVNKEDTITTSSTKAELLMVSCNIMIEGPIDNGLHVTYQLHPFILKSYMPRLHLPRHRYELFFVSPHCRYNLISLVPTWLHISTSSFWNRSPTHRMWAKTVCFDRRLTKTTCRPTPFWTRLGRTLGTSTSASTRPS